MGALRYRDGGMTRADAKKLTDKLWSDGNAIGQVRWRRYKTPRFWVGVCFADGRPPETKGTSNVDWESAFVIAAGAHSRGRTRSSTRRPGREGSDAVHIG